MNSHLWHCAASKPDGRFGFALAKYPYTSEIFNLMNLNKETIFICRAEVENEN